MRAVWYDRQGRAAEVLKFGELPDPEPAPAAKEQAATELTAAARDGDLTIPIADPLPLDRAAVAHDRVESDNRRRVLLAIPD